MLALNVSFRAGGALETVQAIFRRAEDVRPVLRRWGGWLRKDAKEHFEQQPGWEPLAESTRERLEHTRMGAVTTQGKLRASYVRKSESAFLAQLKGGKVNSGVKLAELRRLARGGSTSFSLQDGTRRYSKGLERARVLLAKAEEQKRLAARQREEDRLDGEQRVGGYQKVDVGGKAANKRAIESHQLLGKLRTAIRAKAEETRVVVENAIPWSRIHNEGGTAGRGARIPARVFLEITQRAAAELAQIAIEHFMGKERR